MKCRKSSKNYTNLGLSRDSNSLAERLNTSSKMASKGTERKCLDVRERVNSKMAGNFMDKMNKADGTSIYKRKG